MNRDNARIEKLRLIGGRVCLDFINTMDPRLGKHPEDYLIDYADLIHWALHVNLLTEQEAMSLQYEACLRPMDATTTFEQAIALREALYRVFSSIAAQCVPQAGDVDLIHTVYVQALTHAHLLPEADVFRWHWPKPMHALDQILWPMVDSAIQLLTSEDVKKVKECPGAGDCGWLFLDMSKNGSRHWCRMEGCGSRVKMRRQYARKQQRPNKTWPPG